MNSDHSHHEAAAPSRHPVTSPRHSESRVDDSIFLQFVSQATMWCRRLVSLSWKETKQFFLDPVMTLFLFYGFGISIVISVDGISEEVKDIALVVIDNDRSEASRGLVDHFRQPYFKLQGYVVSGDEAVRRLDRGESMMVLDIPEGFEEIALSGQPASVQLQIDATNSALAYKATSYAAKIIDQYARSLPGTSESVSHIQAPIVEHRARYWYSPNRSQKENRAVTQLGSITLLLSMLLPATAMAREKERGTIEQLLVTPLSPIQIMLSKSLPMAAIIVAANAFSLIFVVQGFLGLSLRGSIWLFMASTALFSLTMSGLGLVIASYSRNIAQVGLISLMLLPPFNMLSGTSTPPENMPYWLLPLTYSSPLYYYNEIATGTLIKDAGWTVLLDSVAMLLLLASVTFMFGLIRFRKQFQ